MWIIMYIYFNLLRLRNTERKVGDVTCWTVNAPPDDLY